MEVVVREEALILSPLRAIYWPRRKTLLLADMHLGKTGYFRSRGIQIPSTVMADDLARLSLLIDTRRPETVVVAGDMFHHNYNADLDFFKAWRDRYAEMAFVLVPGNHDKLLHVDYGALGVQMTAGVHELEPFTVVHEPRRITGQFVISGHLHPGYTMSGRARQAMRLPCFIITEEQIILPAFSAFTGLYTGYQNDEAHDYYLIGNDTIFRI